MKNIYFSYIYLLFLFPVLICCEDSNASRDKTDPVDSSFTEITVGSKVFHTDLFTQEGTPVVPMWSADQPTDDLRNGAGLNMIEGAEHTMVWRPGFPEDGGYNHYACLIFYKGYFYAMWGNHPLGEDGPGQRVLYSRSKEWGSWSKPKELFPAPGPVKPRTEDGIHLKPDRWVVVDDQLYAVTYVHGAGRYPIARAVEGNETLGDAFVINQRGANLPVFMDEENASQKAIAEKIENWYAQNDQIPWWAWSSAEWGVDREAIDGSSLIESFSYRTKDDKLALMMRNWGTPSNPVHNNRLYVTFKNEGDEWGQTHPTNIPDSPSRAQAITLDDGTVLLIGNQNASSFDEAKYLDRDPLTVAVSKDGYDFSEVYAVRTGSPTRLRFPDVKGKNRGYAYPSAIVHDEWVYILYSIGKEDMSISKFPLSAINL